MDFILLCAELFWSLQEPTMGQKSPKMAPEVQYFWHLVNTHSKSWIRLIPESADNLELSEIV